MVTQAKKVTDLVNETATASEEQTNGIEQISKAIQQMDQVVQQNAANAKETATASEELSSQAQGLNTLVDKIAAEVNMESDKGHTGSTAAAVKKDETGHVRTKATSSPSHKKAAFTHKETSVGTKRGIRSGERNILKPDTQEDNASEDHGRELISANTKPSRLIPMSDDEFKDF